MTCMIDIRRICGKYTQHWDVCLIWCTVYIHHQKTTNEALFIKYFGERHLTSVRSHLLLDRLLHIFWSNKLLKRMEISTDTCNYFEYLAVKFNNVSHTKRQQWHFYCQNFKWLYKLFSWVCLQNQNLLCINFFRVEWNILKL